MKRKKPQSQTVRLNPEASALVSALADHTGQSETKVASAMIITIGNVNCTAKHVAGFQAWVRRQSAFAQVEREAATAVREARKTLKGAGHS